MENATSSISVCCNLWETMSNATYLPFLFVSELTYSAISLSICNISFLSLSASRSVNSSMTSANLITPYRRYSLCPSNNFLILPASLYWLISMLSLFWWCLWNSSCISLATDVASPAEVWHNFQILFQISNNCRLDF